MALSFYKYQGTGNDFIIIDLEQEKHSLNKELNAELVSFLCNRHLGIGADGLIVIHPSEEHDFHMTYYNADGREGSMCGNGGRCAVAFAKMKGLAGHETIFSASDGLHRARIIAANNNQTIVSLQLNDTALPELFNENLIFNTGSPHLILFEDDISQIPVATEGREIRSSAPFEETGINVNFVQVVNHENLLVRTYERGVEDETLSCGTGVTAAALAAWTKNSRNLGNMYNIKTTGGSLKVSFSPPDNKKKQFTDIWLTGPAEWVFKGEIQL